MPWLPAKPRVFSEIFWGGAGHILLSEGREAFSPQRTPGLGSSLIPGYLPISETSCPGNPVLG